MPIHEREEIVKIALEVYHNETNANVVRYLKVIVFFLFGNAAVVIGGVLWLTSLHSRTVSVASDRWTGTMEYVSESNRVQLNPTYKFVPVREIQKDNYPQ